MGRFTTDGAVRSLIAFGSDGKNYQLAEMVQTAKVDLSTSQTSQLTLQLLDPEQKLLLGSIAMKGTDLLLGPWPGGLYFDVRVRNTVTIGKGPGLGVTCRSTGIVRMQRMTSALVRKNISPDAYVSLDAKAAGMSVLAQPTAKRTQIVRPAGSDAWATAQALAQQLGYIVFEASNTLYFGQPSWLVAKLPRYQVTWPPPNSGDPLRGYPQMTASWDDEDKMASGTLTFANEASQEFLPGYSINLAGMGEFNGLYLITGLSVDCDGKSDGQVTIARPVDPVVDASQSSSALDTTGYQSSYPKTNTTTASSHGLVYPVAGEVKGDVSNGMSIYAKKGTSVVAPGAGQVSKVSTSSTGYKARIYHGYGVSTEVTHMQTVAVRVGQNVKRGAKIGTVGQFGKADSYVHLQVFVGTSNYSPMDFMPPLDGMS